MITPKTLQKDLKKFIPLIKKDFSGKIQKHALDYLKAYQDRFLKIINLILERTQKKQKVKILDIGIQYGFYAIILKNRFKYNLFGTDISENISCRCQLAKKAKIPLKAFNLLSNKKNLYPKKYFDVIILGEVIEHIPCAPQVIFNKIKPYLKKNGLIIITTPNIAYLPNIIKLLRGRNIQERFKENWQRKIDSRSHVREYSKNEIINALEKTGYQIDKTKMACHQSHNKLKMWKKILLKIFPKYEKYILIRACKI